MDKIFTSADLILCDSNGGKTLVCLEPGQLAVVVRVLGFGRDEEQETEDYYSPELEAQDPYFTRREQALLVKRAKEVEAGLNLVYHDPTEMLVNG
jgi:hypothetical protein